MNALHHLRQLHQQATPAPWNWTRPEPEHDNPGALIAGDKVVLYAFPAQGNAELIVDNHADAALIAAARNALPHLLDIAEAAHAYVNADDDITDYDLENAYLKLIQAVDRLQDTTP